MLHYYYTTLKCWSRRSVDSGAPRPELLSSPHTRSLLVSFCRSACLSVYCTICCEFLPLSSWLGGFPDFVLAEVIGGMI